MKTHAILCAFAITALVGCTAKQEAPAAKTTAAVTVTSAPYGKLADGSAVESFTLTNAHGVTVKAITYGAIITNIMTPDRAGHMDDIVLGYDSLADYLKLSPYFGAVVGRFANRIAKASFTIDGQKYTLAKNDGPNALHGGLKGLDKQLWTGEAFQHDSVAGVIMRYTSKDGEEGYPGNLAVKVTYTLTPQDELAIDYEATTDKPTPVNISQHSYWNLHGGGRGTILDHLLTIDASKYTPVDSTLIPTGDMADVTGTPFDFRKPTAIGARIGATDTQLRFGKGYDHNWVLDRSGTGMQHVMRVADTTTGRTMDIASTEPGLQFYSGNFLDGTIRGKGGQVYPYRSAIVLETQHFPDAPNHANFPSVILRPGDTLRTRTVLTFGTVR